MDEPGPGPEPSPPPPALDPALIRWSFSVVERRAEHLGVYFYAHLFHHHPGLRAMFPERMSEQRDRLLSALTTAATHVDDTPTLVAYLRDLGFDHRKFGVLPEHYPAVGASLVATLKYFSGAAWTPQVEASWIAAYGVIAQVMVEAAEQVPASVPRYWDAEVTGHRRHGPDLAVLTVRPEPRYPWQPGQYATLTVAEQPRIWRPYSAANAPRADGTLDFHVRRVPGGLLSTALVERVGPGSTVRLGPALGSMTLPVDGLWPGGLLGVAGGTGWAPVRALVEAALGGGLPPQRVTLLVAATDPAAVYDRPTLERLAAAGVRLELVLEGQPAGQAAGQPAGQAAGQPAGQAGPGPDDQAGSQLLHALTRYGVLLRRMAGPQDWPHTYVSGPPAMVEAVRVQLEAYLDVPPERILHDPYGADLPAGGPAAGQPGSAAQWLLLRRERERQLRWIRPRA
jgi:NAD(P)H-flavin reductase/hemoglobin-like flavoprotein